MVNLNELFGLLREAMTMMVVCMEEGTHTRSINGEVERPFMMSIEPLENVHFSEISNSFFSIRR